MMTAFLNFINGEWKAAVSQETITSSNPADAGETVGEVQKSGKEDLDNAVAAADKAKTEWKKIGA
ncbi:aldehyde dehydrogenase family protein, partial [Salibacterium aidingense]|uniref:aldehyde dehydrogenase family protein n=1 Tax=Salibacterium aidingense TaxID=384933 RepID=UPI003BB9C763